MKSYPGVINNDSRLIDRRSSLTGTKISGIAVHWLNLTDNGVCIVAATIRNDIDSLARVAEVKLSST
jgi:hypothetical protein